jgi:hypothetical protein
MDSILVRTRVDRFRNSSPGDHCPDQVYIAPTQRRVTDITDHNSLNKAAILDLAPIALLPSSTAVEI